MSGRRYLCGLGRKVFLPSKDDGILSRISRKIFDLRFVLLDQKSKDRLSREIWSGDAGGSWIEFKRVKYLKGEMGGFLRDVRGPLEAMATDYLKNNMRCGNVIDIGTGSGEFCFALAGKIPNVLFTGLDLNREAVTKNMADACSKGLMDRIGFECADAVEWFKSRPGAGEFLALSVGTLKFFVPARLKELIKAMKMSSGKFALGICEESAPGSTRSTYSGTMGYRHDYISLFKREGLVLVSEKRFFAGGTPILCALARYEGR